MSLLKSFSILILTLFFSSDLRIRCLKLRLNLLLIIFDSEYLDCPSDLSRTFLVKIINIKSDSTSHLNLPAYSNNLTGRTRQSQTCELSYTCATRNAKLPVAPIYRCFTELIMCHIYAIMSLFLFIKTIHHFSNRGVPTPIGQVAKEK